MTPEVGFRKGLRHGFTAVWDQLLSGGQPSKKRKHCTAELGPAGHCFFYWRHLDVLKSNGGEKWLLLVADRNTFEGGAVQ